MKKVIITFIGISIFLVSCTSDKEQPLPVGCTSTIYFAKDVKPIIDAACVGCHFAGAGIGDFAVFSELKAKVDNGSFKNRVFVLKDMPSPSTPLTADELGKLNCWVEQGAPNN
ncbi:MAG: hypothetical protein NTX97_09085 [Bacteroidetes bacterium]|nr:hypothetical protein [Bacteroidota bacterium]